MNILTWFGRNKKRKIPKLGFEDVVKIFFLLAPYVKLIKTMREEYETNTDVGLFFSIVKNLIEQIPKEDLYEIFAICLKMDISDVKKIEVKELLWMIPEIIYENDLYSLYKIFDILGIF